MESANPSIAAALEPGVAEAFIDDRYSLPSDLQRLQDTRGVGATEATVFYAARILEAVSAAAVKAIGLEPSGNVFANLDLLQQFNLIPASTRYWAHALRRLGNDARHLDRRMNEDDAELAALFIERWLHWYFVDFQFGARLGRLTRDGLPLLPIQRPALAELLRAMDAPSFDASAQARRLLQPAAAAQAAGVPAAVWAVFVEMVLARENVLALRVLDNALSRFGADPRLLQLAGLAWSRAGNADKALEYLEPLYARYKDDDETVGTIAGVYKRLYQQDPANRAELLARSFRAYQSGWEKLRNTWLGINAATCALWLGRERESRRIAGEVLAAMRKRLEKLAHLKDYQAMDICYWDQATMAEAELLCGEFAEARRRYAEAFSRFAADTRNIDVTRRQAQAVLMAMGLSGSESFFDLPATRADESLPVLTLGISGHRVLRDAKAIARKIDDAVTILRLLRGPCRLLMLSPLAEGADRLAARLVRSAGGSVHAVMPLELADYRNDFVEASSKLEFATILEQCDRLIAPTAAAAPKNGDAREAAYEAAGRLIVDRCDVMLAVWDGQPPRGRGGTAEIVEYARRQNKSLIWIESQAPFAVTYERIDLLAQ